MYLKNILQNILLWTILSSPILIAGDIIISNNLFMKNGENRVLEVNGTCKNSNTTPKFTWTIEQKIEDGVFSAENIFNFPPNPNWVDSRYYINGIIHCIGEDDKSKQMAVTIGNPELNCTYKTADGVCVEIETDSSKLNLYRIHGRDNLLNIEHLKFAQYGAKIFHINFLPSPNGEYSIFWTSYSQMRDDMLYMIRFNGNGDKIVAKKRVTSMLHIGSNPKIVLLKNDNFLLHWCHHGGTSRLQLHNKKGEMINFFEYNEFYSCIRKKTANITPLDNGGFDFSFGEYSGSFDSDGNPLDN
jgi:hypothetical protein